MYLEVKNYIFSCLIYFRSNFKLEKKENLNRFSPGDPHKIWMTSSYKIRVPGLWTRRYKLTDAYTGRESKSVFEQ